ncbi:hypothetical protein N0V87_006478 [Didymella glomerata]|jgi:type II secretory pathway component PulJ|uniref:Uncharacterized protein n=1 Tax=Didymella glomerata TaxID=749621 RepID=A0A9W8WWN2_9PLEO|nr:hypothetical protein N0V87_006478 [Didymella glomerata]
MADFAGSEVGMVLLLFVLAFIWLSIIRTVARWTLLLAVHRTLLEQQQHQQHQQQQQQQQQELERQARLHFYLDNLRRRAMAAATAAEHAQHVQEDLAWAREMDDRGDRLQEAIQAYKPAVAARHAVEEGYEVYRRRDLEIKLGRLEEDAKHREDAAIFSKYDDKQQYRPAKDGLLYDSDDEDSEVIRGDKKGKKDK